MDELIDIEDYVDEFELPYDDFQSVYHGDAFLYLDKRGYLEKVKVSLYDTYWEENSSSDTPTVKHQCAYETAC